MTKRIITAIGTIFLTVFIGTFASAAVQCKVATISQTGPFPTLASEFASQYMVELDCADDTKWSGAKQFMLSKDLGEGGYATLLTAFSLDKTINVTVESLAFRALLTRIYVGAPPAL